MGTTWTANVALVPPSDDPVIVATPLARPVAVPPASIVRTLWLLDVQVMALVVVGVIA